MTSARSSVCMSVFIRCYSFSSRIPPRYLRSAPFRLHAYIARLATLTLGGTKRRIGESRVAGCSREYGRTEALVAADRVHRTHDRRISARNRGHLYRRRWIIRRIEERTIVHPYIRETFRARQKREEDGLKRNKRWDRWGCWWREKSPKSERERGTTTPTLVHFCTIALSRIALFSRVHVAPRRTTLRARVNTYTSRPPRRVNAK